MRYVLAAGNAPGLPCVDDPLGVKLQSQIKRAGLPLPLRAPYAWFRERVKKLEDDPSYDSSDWHEAMKRAMRWGDEIPIGKFFQRTDLPSLDQAEPILDQGGPLANS